MLIVAIEVGIDFGGQLREGTNIANFEVCLSLVEYWKV